MDNRKDYKVLIRVNEDTGDFYEEIESFNLRVHVHSKQEAKRVAKAFVMKMVAEDQDLLCRDHNGTITGVTYLDNGWHIQLLDRWYSWEIEEWKD